MRIEIEELEDMLMDVLWEKKVSEYFSRNHSYTFEATEYFKQFGEDCKFYIASIRQLAHELTEGDDTENGLTIILGAKDER